METGYASYLKGCGSSTQLASSGVSIFEAGDHSPIREALAQRSVPIVYRFISNPRWIAGRRTPEHIAAMRDSIESRVSQLQDAIAGVPWNAGRVPYPFPEGMFDEVHMHMIDAPLMSISHVEYPITGVATIPFFSMTEFASEFYRLLRDGGRAYLTTDSSFFFNEGINDQKPTKKLEEEANRMFPSNIMALASSLLAGGFSINVLEWSAEYHRKYRGEMSAAGIDDPRYFDERGLMIFTDFYSDAFNLLIATKDGRKH